MPIYDYVVFRRENSNDVQEFEAPGLDYSDGVVVSGDAVGGSIGVAPARWWS